MTATLPTTTAKDGFLRFALRLDAVCSGLVGLAGLAIAPRLAAWSGTTPAFEYAFSAFLVAYGIVVYALSRRPAVRVPGIWVIAANLAFTVGAVILVIADVMPLTTVGVVVTLASGVYTLVMADLQYVGLRRLRA